MKAKEVCGTELIKSHGAQNRRMRGSIPETELDTLHKKDKNTGNKIDLKISEFN